MNQKKKIVLLCLAMGFSSLVIAKVMDCDLDKCNVSRDGLVYCPKDACKEPGKGAGGGS